MENENTNVAPQEPVSTEPQAPIENTPNTEPAPQINETTPQEPQAQEPTEPQAPAEPETFLGTYRTKEDAEKGLSEKDRYINELKDKINAIQEAQDQAYKQMGYESQQQFQDVQIEQQLTSAYQTEKDTISQDYEYQIARVNQALEAGQINELQYNDYINYWNDQKADALATAKLNDKQRRESVKQYKTAEQQKAQESFKNSMYEQHTEHKDILDLFFDPQPTIEKAIALKQAIIDNYKASLETVNENNEAKSRLQSAVNNGSTNFDNPNRVFSREEINKMDTKTFAKYEKQIFDQMAKGQIK